MGYGMKDIDLADQQPSLLETGTTLAMLPHGAHMLGCFSDQLREELREISRKTSAMFYYSEQVI